MLVCSAAVEEFLRSPGFQRDYHRLAAAREVFAARKEQCEQRRRAAAATPAPGALTPLPPNRIHQVEVFAQDLIRVSAVLCFACWSYIAV